jgi:hypothetical protein
MSIVWVVPMLARSYGESPPAGEPDLIRQPGVASSATAGIRSAAPAGRCAVRAHARARIPSCLPGHGLWRRAAPGQRSQSSLPGLRRPRRMPVRRPADQPGRHLGGTTPKSGVPYAARKARPGTAGTLPIPQVTV